MKLCDHFIVTVLLCWVTPDFELYAAFDPLADKVLLLLMYLRLFSCISILTFVMMKYGKLYSQRLR